MPIFSFDAGWAVASTSMSVWDFSGRSFDMVLRSLCAGDPTSPGKDVHRCVQISKGALMCNGSLYSKGHLRFSIVFVLCKCN